MSFLGKRVTRKDVHFAYPKVVDIYKITESQVVCKTVSAEKRGRFYFKFFSVEENLIS